MRIQLTALLLALPLALAACSGPSDPKALIDEATQSLNSGDFKGAKGGFESALAALGDDKSDPSYMRAKMGWIEAEAHIDGESAKEAFLELAGTAEANFQPKDYIKVGSILSSAKNYTPAVYVVDAGVKAFPDDEKLQKVIEKLQADVAAADDPAATAALDGLGYTGD